MAKYIQENSPSSGLFVLLVSLWMFEAVLYFLLSSDGYFYWVGKIKIFNASVL